MRRRRRAYFVPIDSDDGDRPPREFADTSARSASEQVSETELQDAISSAIASLPEAQRMAVVLRRFEGMPYEEIAKVLGTTVPAVKSLLFRARTDLKERLKNFLIS
jgi:RNA polymerase sigma-70 factor (ECF subfamily)